MFFYLPELLWQVLTSFFCEVDSGMETKMHFIVIKDTTEAWENCHVFTLRSVDVLAHSFCSHLMLQRQIRSFFVLNFEESCFVGFCKLLSIIFSKIIFSCCSFSIVCFLLRNRSFASSNICEIKKAKQDLIVARCVWAGKCAKLSHTSFPVVCAFGFGFSMTQVPYKQKQTTFNNVFDPG